MPYKMFASTDSEYTRGMGLFHNTAVKMQVYDWISVDTNLKKKKTYQSFFKN